jgi:hypothetical protein
MSLGVRDTPNPPADPLDPSSLVADEVTGITPKASVGAAEFEKQDLAGAAGTRRPRCCHCLRQTARTKPCV